MKKFNVTVWATGQSSDIFDPIPYTFLHKTYVEAKGVKWVSQETNKILAMRGLSLAKIVEIMELRVEK